MALADAAATGDANPLDEDAAARELQFRDEQLMRLKEEAIALEDVPTLGDFTMDYFLAQLRQYLEKNKAELESAPLGAYAITPPKPANVADSGVIFLLRQTNTQAPNPASAPQAPFIFFLVYIKNDGTIRYGCASIRQALELFEKTAASQTKPITHLCDWFDHETKNGKQMQRYDELLKKVADHIRQAHNDAQFAALKPGGGREFILPKASESPNNANDFGLVTWLIIASKN